MMAIFTRYFLYVSESNLDIVVCNKESHGVAVRMLKILPYGDAFVICKSFGHAVIGHSFVFI
jgi:hypothetical protein